MGFLRENPTSTLLLPRRQTLSEDNLPMESLSGGEDPSPNTRRATAGEISWDIPEDDCRVEELSVWDSTSPGHAAKSGVSDELGIVNALSTVITAADNLCKVV